MIATYVFLGLNVLGVAMILWSTFRSWQRYRRLRQAFRRVDSSKR